MNLEDLAQPLQMTDDAAEGRDLLQPPAVELVDDPVPLPGGQPVAPGVPASPVLVADDVLRGEAYPNVRDVTDDATKDRIGVRDGIVDVHAERPRRPPDHARRRAAAI